MLPAVHAQMAVLETMRTVRPTVFLGIPWAWARLADVAQGATTVSAWARRKGLKGSLKLQRGESVNWKFKYAERTTYSKIKKSLGLDRCRLPLSTDGNLTPAVAEFFLAVNLIVYEIYGAWIAGHVPCRFESRNGGGGGCGHFCGPSYLPSTAAHRQLTGNTTPPPRRMLPFFSPSLPHYPPTHPHPFFPCCPLDDMQDRPSRAASTRCPCPAARSRPALARRFRGHRSASPTGATRSLCGWQGPLSRPSPYAPAVYAMCLCGPYFASGPSPPPPPKQKQKQTKQQHTTTTTTTHTNNTRAIQETNQHHTPMQVRAALLHGLSARRRGVGGGH